MDGGTQTSLKLSNQRAIVQYIYKNGISTRAELSKQLNLSKPTISFNVKELMEAKILEEVGLEDTAIGKKGTLLQICYQEYYVLVVDIITHFLDYEIGVSICNLQGNQIVDTRIRMNCLMTNEHLPQLIREIKVGIINSCNSENINRNKIKTIVFPISGVMHQSYSEGFFTSLEKEMIHSEFTKEFHCSCYFINDINSALLGEMQAKNLSMTKNLCYVWLDQGLGGSFAIDKQLYEGNHHSAGEFGFYQTHVLEGERWTKTMLKDYLSLHAIVKYLNSDKEAKSILKDMFKEVSEFDFSHLLYMIHEEHPFFLKYRDQLREVLGEFLYNIAISFDLDAIILGGHLLQIDERMEEKLQEYMDDCELLHCNIQCSYDNTAITRGCFYVGCMEVMNLLVQ